jgi:hypothetical protein
MRLAVSVGELRSQSLYPNLSSGGRAFLAAELVPRPRRCSLPDVIDVRQKDLAGTHGTASPRSLDR